MSSLWKNKKMLISCTFSLVRQVLAESIFYYFFFNLIATCEVCLLWESFPLAVFSKCEQLVVSVIDLCMLLPLMLYGTGCTWLRWNSVIA